MFAVVLGILSQKIGFVAGMEISDAEPPRHLHVCVRWQVVLDGLDLAFAAIAVEAIVEPLLADSDAVVAQLPLMAAPHLHGRMVLPALLAWIEQRIEDLDHLDALLAKPPVIQTFCRQGEVRVREECLHGQLFPRYAISMASFCHQACPSRIS